MCSVKKCSEKNFKFSRKVPVLESLLNKVAGHYEIFKNTYLEEHVRTTASVISFEVLVVKCESKCQHFISCDTRSESRKWKGIREFLDLKLKISFHFIFV